MLPCQNFVGLKWYKSGDLFFTFILCERMTLGPWLLGFRTIMNLCYGNIAVSGYFPSVDIE